jgi:hypothetical protein
VLGSTLRSIWTRLFSRRPEVDYETQATDELQENIHYELIPGPDGESDEIWHIRILDGDFTETVIQFGILHMMDDGYMRYNFEVISSPDPDATPENGDLQDYAGLILYSILDSATSKDQDGHH